MSSKVFGSLVRRGRREWAIWLLVATVVLVLPLTDLLLNFFNGGGDTWDHLARTVLPRYIANTLVLGAGTLALSGSIGTWAAWLMARYSFPGKRLVEVLLVLPLALPPYIAAYAWSGLFDYGSALRNMLTALIGAETAARVGVANMAGAVFVLAMALYPYVYLSLRSTMAGDLAPQLEAARNLGMGRRALFFRMALPLARPSLAAGLGLVLMEVLNEYGAVSYLGVDTLTAGIFRAWFHFYDMDAARRIGGILLIFVFLLLGAEARQRARKRYYSTNNRRRNLPEALRGTPLARAYVGLGVILTLALGAPVGKLIDWAFRTWSFFLRAEYRILVANTLLLSLGAVAVCLILAVTLVYARKLLPAGILSGFSRLAFMGYAIPGAVIALGVMRLGGRVDHWLTGGRQLFLSGSAGALIYAYTIRYLPIAQRPVSAVLEERYAAMDEASLSLGRTPLMTLLRIHLPNMTGTLAAAAVMVFLDVVKELPLTMILRPFDLNTLAVRTFELAANEQVPESSVPALTLVLISTIGVTVMSLTGARLKERT